MDFIPVLDSYAQDTEASHLWSRLAAAFGGTDGIAFYKHPTLGSPNAAASPDFVVVARGFEPFVVRIVRQPLDEIARVERDSWFFKDGSGFEVENDSPELLLDDAVTELANRFQRDRTTRNRIKPRGLLFFPHVARQDFEHRFGTDVLVTAAVLWGSTPVDEVLVASDEAFTDLEWRLVKSIFQAAASLNAKAPALAKSTAATLGETIRILERQIALLDDQQLRGAVQIPPGPQRIRGLAGSGKTVLLAMKAASIHSHYPEAKILFTFWTQSLYNQTTRLISRFFKAGAGDAEPDWDKLHVRHAWGNKQRTGVYRDIAFRLGVPPLALPAARMMDPASPFRAACKTALASPAPVLPEYDFVLVDEGQDLPVEFFQLLLKLTRPPHKIYFAYDEMQNLASLELPNVEDFGRGPTGAPLISLDGDPYPGPIEKDLVLNKSYRCPIDVLMVAHAVGLGIHGPRGCVQMLRDRASWEAVGYQIETGRLQKGEDVVILRPEENSPNLVRAIYTGQRKCIETKVLDSRDAELDWIVASVIRDVQQEGVKPEDIVVTAFDQMSARGDLQKIQYGLAKAQISSTMPGLGNDAAEFAETNRVTLATPYRAKGNEAPVVYLMGCELLHTFAEEVEGRNRAFTCISRSKGWVSISGVGPRMRSFELEIERILADVPRFKFQFPDMAQIPALDAAETTRRRQAVKQAERGVRSILSTDESALADLNAEELAEAIERLRRARDQV